MKNGLKVLIKTQSLKNLINKNYRKISSRKFNHLSRLVKNQELAQRHSNLSLPNLPQEVLVLNLQLRFHNSNRTSINRRVLLLVMSKPSKICKKN